jgi:hypothetical protein
MILCSGFSLFWSKIEKLNRADSKNSFMTVTWIQQIFYLKYLNFWISKDILWAYGFNSETTSTLESFCDISHAKK